MNTSSEQSIKMSIVAEILTTRGKNEIEDISVKITSLASKINDFKLEADTILDNKYGQFKSQLEESQNLAYKMTILSQQMNELNNKIENETKNELHNSTSELKSLSAALQEMNIQIFVTKKLVDLDDKLTLINDCLKRQEYDQSAQILLEIKSGLKSVDSKCEPAIMNGILYEISKKFDLLLRDVTLMWRESIGCEHVIEGVGSPYVLRVNVANPDHFTNLVCAMYKLNELSVKMKLLADKLMTYILTPLICHTCTLTRSEGALAVTVESKKKPEPILAISRVKDVFEYLAEQLDLTVMEDTTFLSLLGNTMANTFCNLFIKEILSASIPSNNDERAAYEDVLFRTKQLEVYLHDLAFLSDDNHSILEYAGNVDIHFANKMCEQTLDRARTLIKKDLHDTTEIQPEYPPLPIIEQVTKGSGDSEPIESFASLSKNTLQFPTCVISTSVLELEQLLRSVLKETNTASEMRAVRLFEMSRSIITMYCSIGPVHHKKFLDTLPQQAALFHNNSMYLSHQLLLLGPEFQSLLAPLLPLRSCTMVDLSCQLRQTGANIFLGQMKVQKQQLLDILRDSGLSNLGEGDRLPLSTEKSIRQCLRQLELLQRVWQNVLPTNVYNKSIGTLLNTLVEELVVRVCTAEDIPAETASDLVTVFTTVLDRAPRVLMEAGEVHQFVRRWRALEELVQVLGANLQGIEDRWTKGKGPLAHEFSPDSVKQLVRALFQNTTRRAALLAKIK